MEYMLQKLGYSMPIWRMCFPLIPKYIKGKYSEIFQIAKQYNAFQDNPWNFPKLYKKFDQMFDAKFILTIRDSKDWLNSLERWIEKFDGVKNMAYGKEFHEYFYGTNGTIKGNENKYTSFYDEHNENILNYFKGKSNFIAFNFWEGDGWKKLCNFLDKQILDERIPHRNKN